MACVLRSEASLGYQSPTPSPLPGFLVVPVHTKLVGPPASADSLVSASHHHRRRYRTTPSFAWVLGI